MREHPEQPVFGPETPKLDPPNPPRIKVWRSIAKAATWRTLGTLDTLLLSYLLITYLGPTFGMSHSQGEAIESASYIAISEVITKSVLYFLHERGWAKTGWGVTSKNGKRREAYRRTSIKAATWRTIASLDTFLLAWYFTGNVGTALSIGGLEIVTKLILYFLHERVWSFVPVGIVHQPAAKPMRKQPLEPGKVRPAPATVRPPR